VGSETIELAENVITALNVTTPDDTISLFESKDAALLAAHITSQTHIVTDELAGMKDTLYTLARTMVESEKMSMAFLVNMFEKLEAVIGTQHAKEFINLSELKGDISRVVDIVVETKVEVQRAREAQELIKHHGFLTQLLSFFGTEGTMGSLGSCVRYAVYFGWGVAVYIFLVYGLKGMILEIGLPAARKVWALLRMASKYSGSFVLRLLFQPEQTLDHTKFLERGELKQVDKIPLCLDTVLILPSNEKEARSGEISLEMIQAEADPGAARLREYAPKKYKCKAKYHDESEDVDIMTTENNPSRKRKSRVNDELQRRTYVGRQTAKRKKTT